MDEQYTLLEKIDLFKISWGGILDIDVSFIDYQWERSSKSLVTKPLLFDNAVDAGRNELLSSRCKDIIIIKPLGDFVV